jgi:integrase/recombinase XerD
VGERRAARGSRVERLGGAGPGRRVWVKRTLAFAKADALVINPQTDARIRAYTERAGHEADRDGPLFRPLRHNSKRTDIRRSIDPDAIDRVLRKYAVAIGQARRYSAHSTWATFFTTALEKRALLEGVPKAAGHRGPSTTKSYDRRGYNPKKAASLFATY